MKLLTTYGFVKLEDIKLGDSLVHEDSTVSLVTEKTPSSKMHYLLKMQDGTELILTDQVDIEYHVARSGRKSKLWSITQALVKFDQQVAKGPKQDNNTPKLITKLTSPIQFNRQEQKELLIDPYTLGVVLGDGCITQNTCKVTSADYQIISNIESFGYQCNLHNSKSDNAASDYCIIGLSTILRKYNLIGCNSYSKFIPEDYLNSSIDSRYSIVQGLMDTDGYIDSGGKTEYCTISPSLRDGMKYLLQSLGHTVTVSEKKTFYKNKHGDKVQGQLAYNLYIRGNDQINLFRLDRKLARVKTKQHGNRIEDMSEIGNRSTYEIRIETDKPVLAEGFIPVFLRKKVNR